MTRREILLNIATENDIEFVDYPCGEKEALLCIIPWGGAKIGIDYDKIKSPADEIVKMAHELGHYITDSYYDANIPLETRERCEYKANTWAIKQLIPWTELYLALEDGIVDARELAEYFNVTLCFMELALDYYITRKGYLHNARKFATE